MEPEAYNPLGVVCFWWNITWLKIPTGQWQTRLQKLTFPLVAMSEENGLFSQASGEPVGYFTSVAAAGDLNSGKHSGLPWTNTASGQGGTWTWGPDLGPLYYKSSVPSTVVPPFKFVLNATSQQLSRISGHFWHFFLQTWGTTRADTKISSGWVCAVTRWGIEQIRSYFVSIIFLFPMKVAGDHAHKNRGKSVTPGPDSAPAPTPALTSNCAFLYRGDFLLRLSIKFRDELNFQIPN